MKATILILGVILILTLKMLHRTPIECFNNVSVNIRAVRLMFNPRTGLCSR